MAIIEGNSIVPPNIQNNFHKQEKYETIKNKHNDETKGQ